MIMIRTLFLTVLLTTLHLASSQDAVDEVSFLAHFGYLDSGSGDLEDLINVPDDVKSDAISEFQTYYGLAVTGVLDDATRVAMLSPRCGVKDKESSEEIAGIGNVVSGATDDDEDEDEEENVSENGQKKKRRKKKKNKSKALIRSKRYVTSHTKWRNNKLSYRFLNYTSDIPQVMTRNAFKEAFGMWEEVSALQFYEEFNPDIPADIEIAYISGLHEDGSPFSNLVLGHAFFPRVGWLHMNDLQRWNYNSHQGTDTTFVAVHELGHILGLRHSKRKTIMHASYPGYSPDIKLSNDDIRGIQSLYGVNPCYPNNPCQNGGSCSKDSKGGRGYDCTCQQGYKGLKCQMKETQVVTQKCRAITIDNGSVQPEGRLSPMQSARITCNRGFELVGASQFTCTHRGFYAPPTFNTICRRKVLCQTPSIEHGEVFPKRPVEVESVVSVSCDNGYLIAGSKTLKCTRDGSFDRETPTCEKIVEKEEEEEEETGCPDSFDDLSGRTTRDSMVYAFKGSRYWIYRKGETGAPKSHWKNASPISHGFPSIPTHLDAVFAFTDPTSRNRYMLFVKAPHVYFWNIVTRRVDRVADFQSVFNIPGGLEITAAHRWDDNTIYFFVPFGYYVYKIQEQSFDPPTFQPMTTFRGMSPRVTATAVSRSFYNDIFNLFVGDKVYQIRISDKQVLRNNPYDVSALWRYGLTHC